MSIKNFLEDLKIILIDVESSVGKVKPIHELKFW